MELNLFFLIRCPIKEGNGSFAWKSILKGRKAIKKGVQWRVGNMFLVRIYHDNPHNKRVVSPRDFLGCDARVAMLIDRDQNYWMKETIDNIFLPHEAALIQSIPLSLRECEDQFFGRMLRTGHIQSGPGTKGS